MINLHGKKVLKSGQGICQTPENEVEDPSVRGGVLRVDFVRKESTSRKNCLEVNSIDEKDVLQTCHDGIGQRKAIPEIKVQGAGF